MTTRSPRGADESPIAVRVARCCEADYEAAMASVRQRDRARFAAAVREERATAAARSSISCTRWPRSWRRARSRSSSSARSAPARSALINALVGEAVAEVNVRGGWTKDVWNVGWNGAGYCVPGLANSQVVLIDTPGLNEVDGAQRAAMAHEAAARADLVLFVTDSDFNEVEYSALVELAASHKPILLVLNKADLYPPQELGELMSVFHGPRLAGIVDPENVVTAKADPRQVEYFIESADGRTRQRMAQARARCGRAAGADSGSARRRRQGAGGAQRGHVRRRQERSHGAPCACGCGTKRRRPRSGASR